MYIYIIYVCNILLAQDENSESFLCLEKYVASKRFNQLRTCNASRKGARSQQDFRQLNRDDRGLSRLSFPPFLVFPFFFYLQIHLVIHTSYA